MTLIKRPKLLVMWYCSMLAGLMVGGPIACNSTPKQADSAQKAHAANDGSFWRADNWFQEVLADAQIYEVDEEGEVFIEALFEEQQGLNDDTYAMTKGHLQVEAIMLFIRSGPPIIRELIEYVHDERYTWLVFQFPTSSHWNVEPMKVGELACYLIEAIARDRIWVACMARPSYPAPTEMSDREQRNYALDRAATCCEEWYDTCFDEESGKVTCGPERLPIVNWKAGIDP